MILLGLLILPGCGRTFQLYIHNDTPHPYALRIGDSADAYALQPSSRQHLPRKLRREAFYELTLLDHAGKEHRNRIFANSPQLFIRLHESPLGVIEWDVGPTEPNQ